MIRALGKRKLEFDVRSGEKLCISLILPSLLFCNFPIYCLADFLSRLIRKYILPMMLFSDVGSYLKLGGHNLPPLIEIGLTDLPKPGWAIAHLTHPYPTSLNVSIRFHSSWKNIAFGTKEKKRIAVLKLFYPYFLIQKILQYN